jgi:hypothetical protein
MTLFAFLHRERENTVLRMQRLDRTELEFAVVAMCLIVPGGYWLIRTLLELI